MKLVNPTCSTDLIVHVHECCHPLHAYRQASASWCEMSDQVSLLKLLLTCTLAGIVVQVGTFLQEYWAFRLSHVDRVVYTVVIVAKQTRDPAEQRKALSCIRAADQSRHRTARTDKALPSRQTSHTCERMLQVGGLRSCIPRGNNPRSPGTRRRKRRIGFTVMRSLSQRKDWSARFPYAHVNARAQPPCGTPSLWYTPYNLPRQ